MDAGNGRPHFREGRRRKTEWQMPATMQSGPGSEEFALLTDQFRPELLVHCYRMLGSVQDAEDQVQETLLRAWRGYGSFEGRSSLRTWLYRIATNACRSCPSGSARC
jgi:RNA polymerase sigma-70 factor (ECF subfamily)